MSTLFNRRDLDFQLFEVLGLADLCATPRYGDHDRTSLGAVLDLAQKLAEEELWPHAAALDRNEPRVEDGKVRIEPAVGDALAKLREAGFFAAHLDHDQGGLQLPHLVLQACHGLMKGANVSTAGYLMLTKAAANLLAVHGTDEQKRLLMAPMTEGRYFGTMCLSEPDVGSALGDLRCRAEPADNGAYRLEGAKMWISGGDHELAENIVHLVLARLPDAPPGVRGISLFAVPKRRVGADGTLGADNHIALAGLNHKMGYRGITNCLLNFGETGESLGTLVGAPHRGLAAMFHMMNEARIGVGLGAIMLGTIGYRLSLAYAKERRQGRALDDKDPRGPPVPIIRHGDVRRMLLLQKCYSEGALALALYGARLLDEQATADSEDGRAEAAALLDLLTPVIKAWPSWFCLEANSLAIQVHGGAGYTRDVPVERLYRDNRLNAIHEGTNGIQALDLLGRKVAGDEGRALALFAGRVEATLAATAGDLESERDALRAALHDLTAASEATRQRVGTAGKAAALVNATPYLHAFGHVAVAWRWLEQAGTAQAALARSAALSETERTFYQGKILAARFFCRHELPLVAAWLGPVAAGDTTVLDIDEAGF